MIVGFVWAPIVMAQLLLGARVLRRLARTAGGRPITATGAAIRRDEMVAVAVPVLNERDRLAPCLDGLIAQGPEVGEILVVDGGSNDGTHALVAAYAARDARVHLVDAGPLVPPGWNGKAWGLQVGLEASRPDATWLLTVDADVRMASLLTRSLLSHAHHNDVPALSVATLQEMSGPGEAIVHPALLATLVYRLGSPGRATRRVDEVQANGQCFLARRDALLQTGAFSVARDSRCEDITVARCLVAAGYRVGFYEAGGLVSVQMYGDWREAWRNWPRSLPLRDRFSGRAYLLGLLEVTLVQALPLPLCLGLLAGLLRSRLNPSPTCRSAGGVGQALPEVTNSITRGTRLAVNGALALTRLGVLAGMARAYRRVPSSYWLSPLCDLPVAIRLWISAAQRRHTWRGRVLVDVGSMV